MKTLKSSYFIALLLTFIIFSCNNNNSPKSIIDESKISVQELKEALPNTEFKINGASYT